MFNAVEPRTREERAAYKDKDRVEQLRLRERIGGYFKYVDNALINNPDQSTKATHYIDEKDRFDKDFAAHEKQIREQKRL